MVRFFHLTHRNQLHIVKATTRNVVRHSIKARALYRTDISSPRWLRAKGTDTEPISGCRLGSGETGIRVSDRNAQAP